MPFGWTGQPDDRWAQWADRAMPRHFHCPECRWESTDPLKIREHITEHYDRKLSTVLTLADRKFLKYLRIQTWEDE